MDILNLKEKKLDFKSSTIREVLNYFSSKENQLSKNTIDNIASAGDIALTDDILFEEFENWTKYHDDETFLYLINHYWESNPKVII